METQTKTSVTCPLCGGTSTTLYVRKNECDVYACVECKLKFVHPLPGSFEEIYGKDYFAGAADGYGYVDYDADKEPMRGAFQKYLEIIRRLRPEAKSIFDVGAATGFFLDMAREKGFRVSGVEISEFAASLAREKGIEVKTGVLTDMPNEESFDVLTMLDVIEHVQNPEVEIAKAYSMISDSGLLVINTPDAGSVYARLLGRRWHLIVPPEHLFYFDRENIKLLLERNGFKVVMVTTIGKSFTFPYLFRTLHGWTTWRVFDVLARRSSVSFFRSATIPINLGDNMFLVAEKV